MGPASDGLTGCTLHHRCMKTAHMYVRSFRGVAAAVLLIAFAGLVPALADTMEAALVRAYRNNPQLNAQRAQVRSTDENVPQALSAYRPKVALTASVGFQYADTLSSKGSTAAEAVLEGRRRALEIGAPDIGALEREQPRPAAPAPQRQPAAS